MKLLIEIIRTLFLKAPKVLPSAPKSLAVTSTAVARKELLLGACEEGSNNMGPHVRKYSGTQGVSWCAYFVSWCFRQGAELLGEPLTFKTSGGAKKLVKNILAAGGKELAGPEMGCVVLWHRGKANSWQGHVGICDGLGANGKFWTIEGNRGNFPSKVDRFSHVVGEAQLLKFVRVP